MPPFYGIEIASSESMRGRLRSWLSVFIIFSLIWSSPIRAQDGGRPRKLPVGSYVVVGGVGVVFWGIHKRSFGIGALGLLVIFSGTLSTASHSIYDIFVENTELDIYGGKDLQAKAEVGPLLQEIEMTALTIATNPGMESSLPMVDVMEHFQLDPQRISHILVSAKTFGDHVLGKEVGDEVIVTDMSPLLKETGSLSEKEIRIVKNYLRLRNIAI